MAICDLSYFQTIDAEKYMGDVERMRARMISDLNDLYGLIDDPKHSSDLNTAIESLEALEAVLDWVWDDIKARQETLEDANPMAVLALKP